MTVKLNDKVLDVAALPKDSILLRVLRDITSRENIRGGTSKSFRTAFGILTITFEN
jgi:hypothetical protein